MLLKAFQAFRLSPFRPPLTMLYSLAWIIPSRVSGIQNQFRARKHKAITWRHSSGKKGSRAFVLVFGLWIQSSKSVSGTESTSGAGGGKNLLLESGGLVELTADKSEQNEWLNEWNLINRDCGWRDGGESVWGWVKGLLSMRRCDGLGSKKGLQRWANRTTQIHFQVSNLISVDLESFSLNHDSKMVNFILKFRQRIT